MSLGHCASGMGQAQICWGEVKGLWPTGHPFSCNSTQLRLWGHWHNLISPLPSPGLLALTHQPYNIVQASHTELLPQRIQEEKVKARADLFLSLYIPFVAGSKDLTYRCFRNHSWISVVWAGAECSLVLQQYIKHNCISAGTPLVLVLYWIVLQCLGLWPCRVSRRILTAL